jgi:ATP-dependent helicase/nuclease subunit A
MSKVSFSRDQRRAIDEGGNNILVSASAGSGKTTVLIERILTQLKSETINIDELLIVTFTEASAKEMKQRLRVKLSETLAEEPNRHLRKQLMRLANANISTFHAFCNSVIQKFFYLIDVESKYQIGSTIELFMIADEVLESLFEDLYEQKDEGFLLLVNRFTSSRSDDDLKKVILDLYNKLRNIPFREPYLEKVESIYHDFNDLSDFKHRDALYQSIETLIKRAKGYFDTAYDLAKQPINGHAYESRYQDDLIIINDLLERVESKDYERLYYYVKELKLKNFSSKCLDTCDDTIKDIIKDLRDKGKKTIEQLKDKYFSFSQVSQVKFIKENQAVLKQLLRVVDLYEQAFRKAKRDRSMVDFHDLEELTLKIFSFNDYDNDAVHYYRNLFKEILVDEYQDTNSMQETIVQAISNKKNVFTVGDVKQSIYRFRNAEPEIFQTKYREFGDPHNQTGMLINLNANYRSRKEVLHFINYLFSQVMDYEVGEILYDDLASLKEGAPDAYPPLEDSLIELAVIDRKQVLDEVDENYSKLEIEAHYVAKKIRQLIEDGTQVYDGKRKMMRPLSYSDIVILSRSVKNEQAVYHEVFKEYNIPLLATDLAGYFNSIEVLTVTSLLEIIDNPLQDIPLVAVLRSPFGKITEKELIQIHANAKEINTKFNYFYDKMMLYIRAGNDADLSKKLKDFVEQINHYREAIKNESLSDLLFSIYHETNYYDFVKGQISGRQRQANLDLLYERSKEFQDLASNSLFKFVNLIKFLKENDQDLEQARTVSENEDLVRFMSIHKSKGLEFPVVFIINLSKRYNTSDESDQILFDKDLGIAFSYRDLEYRVSYDSIYQSIIKDKLHRQMLAEEMRLLYVALTRAKERLYLVSTVKEIDQLINKYYDVLNQEDLLLPANLRMCDNYLELILMTLMRHPEVKQEFYPDVALNCDERLLNGPRLKFQLIDALDFKTDERHSKQLIKEVDSNYFEEFHKRLNFSYPHQAKTEHFAKLSISDIKHLNRMSDYSYQPNQLNFKVPSFIEPESAMTRGTSYHKFMQHIDYRQSYTIEALQELKHHLCKQDILTEEDLSFVDENFVLQFLEQDVTKRFKEAVQIHKELPFTTLVDAQTIYPDYPLRDDVLLQGVMDLVIVFNNEVYLLDFKTDRIENTIESKERIKKNYHTQISYYKNAVQALYPNKTVKTVLYLFEINAFISMD